MNAHADHGACEPTALVAQPFATVRSYRRTGGAVVNIEREGRPTRRYRVSLRRYHALREWTAFGSHPYKTSGAWLRSSMTAYLWRS